MQVILIIGFYFEFRNKLKVLIYDSNNYLIVSSIYFDIIYFIYKVLDYL